MDLSDEELVVLQNERTAANAGHCHKIAPPPPMALPRFVLHSDASEAGDEP